MIVERIQEDDCDYIAGQTHEPYPQSQSSADLKQRYTKCTMVPRCDPFAPTQQSDSCVKHDRGQAKNGESNGAITI